MERVSKRIAALFTAAFMMMSLVTGYAMDVPTEESLQVQCTCKVPCTGDLIDPDCPVCAREGAQPEDCGKFVDSDPNPEQSPAGMPLERAARADSIDMTTRGFVLAQGIPIVIRENGRITSIYDANGTLLSGTEDVSNSIIYGGWRSNGPVYSDTSVVMESGRVKEIFGGNYSGVLEGNTSVEINGGSVGWIHGGGYFCDVTGTATVTVNRDAKIWGNHFKDSSAPDDEKGTVFGGGLGGAVNTTKVIFDGGDSGWIYGGGESYDTFTAAVQNASVELKSGSCNYVYGGSLNGEVNQATLSLNAEWDSLYWLTAGGYNDTTHSAQVFIQDNRTSSSDKAVSLNIQGGTAEKTAVTTLQGSGGSSGASDLPKLNLSVIDVQEITVEYGDVNLMAVSGLSVDLSLDRLEVQSAGRVRFQDWKTVEIGTLSGGNGKIVLPAHRVNGSGQLAGQAPVTVTDTIAVDTPLMLETAGTNWSDSELQQCVFFQGPAVEALNSPNGVFASVDYKVQLRQKPDGGKGIYLATRGYHQSVVFSKLSFNQNPSVYNGTLPVTVGVTTQGNWSEMLSSAHLQIRSASQDQILADVQVNGDGDGAVITFPDGTTTTAAVENGGITFSLPVRAAILDTSEEGLDLVFLATDDYYDSTVRLVGPSGENKLQITPAQVSFTDTISEPSYGQTTTIPLNDGPFFTVKAVWHRPNGAAASTFGMGDYQADLILAPKPGHRLSQRSIGETVLYNGTEYRCVFHSNGTVALENVKSASVSGCIVTVEASPAEWGAVTGGGTYDPGANVTVTATPAAGYVFLSWIEDSVEVSNQATYTFSATKNHVLTAVFQQEDSQTKVMVGQGLTQVPEGLKDTEFNTVDKIVAELQRRVKAAISSVGDQIVIYDVHLQYLDENGQWQPMDPADFPEEGVIATLPYPPGTDGTNYLFTVQHMISYGPQAGTVETMNYIAMEDGLRCHFTSFSPVAVGYQQKSSPSDPEGSGDSDSGDRDDDDEFDFWESVRHRIESASSGDTVEVDARSYDQMPWRVMDALKQRGNITLVIRWNGGEDIVIPAGKAQTVESLRIYYPLSLLAELYANNQAVDLNKFNPETGGVWQTAPEHPRSTHKTAPFFWSLFAMGLAATGWYLWRKNGHKKKISQAEND